VSAAVRPEPLPSAAPVPVPDHASVLTSLGWDDAWASARAQSGAAGEPGRVGRVDRGRCDVLTAAGPVAASASGDLLTRFAADPTSAPAVGDWVLVRRWPDDRVTIEAVLPRRSAFVRAVASGRSYGQVVASNVDVVLVVVSLEVEPDLGRVERLLALAWESGAAPVVVLTKADLVPDAEQVRTEVSQAAPGADVLVVSGVTGDGLDALREHVFVGRTLALIGASGVGKSTLVNALRGAEVAATAETRSDGKGRHTTTHRELITLPSGGVLVDTPGLRGVGLWEAVEGIERTFADVEAFTELCRFSDCSHNSEPGCAVLAALDDGELTPRRVESWRKLQREVRYMAMRTDARLRQEVRNTWKQRHLEVRRSGRIRP
jgi:ribosome biogenesis GTPase / thiamine phosphate phosphatase